ncbi:MAG: hypothetical protein GKS05_08775 [Nitrospirales bacterium]|nr:hypothetical protein [Nitrospirales bacterium]
MHGILMEAFATIGQTNGQGLNKRALHPVINDLCFQNPVMTASYSPGDCAHGVGHALMFLTNYQIPEALETCTEFEKSSMIYYCATGVYMEYVTENDPTDAKIKETFYPCDRYDYSAACARYKMVHVVRRHYEARRPLASLKKQCATLAHPFRLGCFHGLGNAHMPLIVAGKVQLRQVCLGLQEDEEMMCIEGAMERMAKFHEKRASQVCEGLQESNKTTCLTAVRQKMYHMDKDLSLYLTK